MVRATRSGRIDFLEGEDFVDLDDWEPEPHPRSRGLPPSLISCEPFICDQVEITLHLIIALDVFFRHTTPEIEI